MFGTEYIETLNPKNRKINYFILNSQSSNNRYRTTSTSNYKTVKINSILLHSENNTNTGDL